MNEHAEIRPLTDCTVHIIGLGLMGASLAMALNGRVARISAQDNQPAVIQRATAEGLIDAGGGPEEADIVVLAVPADAILNVLPTLALRPGTLVIDLGSTKSLIVGAMDRLPSSILAVGGHPMCGRAENGFANATVGLYRGARFILCETARTTAGTRILAEGLVAAVGAVPLWMDAASHDAAVALTSHLPHMLSLALMSLVMISGDDRQGNAALLDLAAGGFDGATRLARTDAPMLVGMFTTNYGPLRAAMAGLRDRLDWLNSLLDDRSRLEAELTAIVAARRAYTGRYGERVTIRSD